MNEKKIIEKLYFNKFRIKKLIVKTSCCSLYEGINIKDNEPVAMKFEKRCGEYDCLESEAFYLFNLKGFGIPKLISYGRNNFYNILIEELLGLSIDELWKYKTNLSQIELLKNISMIAIQGIDRLKYIHSKDIIHGDIKPHNFLIGRKDPKTIYIIDFGFSHKYRSSRTGKHVRFKSLKMIYGSFNFISLNGNKGYELSRRDDLESLGYMLIFLAKNTLPWINAENLKTYNIKIIKEIIKIKEKITPDKLCQGLPEEFTEFIKYSKNLHFDEEPNYEYLKGLFMSVLSKNNYKNDFIFFWIKNENKEERKIVSKRDSSHKRLYNQIKQSLEKIKIEEQRTTLIISQTKSPNNNTFNEDSNNHSASIMLHNNKKNYTITNDTKFQIICKSGNIHKNKVQNKLNRINKNHLYFIENFNDKLK